VGLIGDVKHLRLILATRDRLKEAAMGKKLKVVVFGLGAAVTSALMAQVTGACPTLLANLPTIMVATATGAFGGLATYLMRRPLQKAGGKALVTGAAAAVVASFGATFVPQIELVCGPGFVDKLPSLITPALWIALGLWLKAPHESSGLGSISTTNLNLKG
jgi:hypothetical protein